MSAEERRSAVVPTSRLVRVTDHVWCEVCGEPHATTDDGERLSVHARAYDDLACVEPTHVSELPPDWDRRWVAMHGGGRGGSGFDLYPKEPPLTADHVPLYRQETP